MSIPEEYRHKFDDDGCCEYCGFDGAEWHHWKHHTYEGRASDKKMPLCEARHNANRIKSC